MRSANPTESFVRALTENQNRMYGYIYSLLGDHTRASDVLQECNLVLWRKASEFREGADFIPWAFAVARFQVMAHLRDAGREGKRLVQGDVVELLSDAVEQEADQLEDLRDALRGCVAKLPDNSQRLVELRYFNKLPIQAVADELSRKVSAVKVALMRIRHGLKDCIEREMRRTERPV